MAAFLVFIIFFGVALLLLFEDRPRINLDGSWHKKKKDEEYEYEKNYLGSKPASYPSPTELEKSLRQRSKSHRPKDIGSNPRYPSKRD